MKDCFKINNLNNYKACLKPQQVPKAWAIYMDDKEIDRLRHQGKTNDEIYEIGICSYSLFGKAFFGFKASKAEKQKMNRLWARILQTGKLNAKTSPHSSGN